MTQLTEESADILDNAISPPGETQLQADLSIDLTKAICLEIAALRESVVHVFSQEENAEAADRRARRMQQEAREAVRAEGYE